MLSTQCETKQGDTNAESYLSYLVQPNLHSKRQRLPSLKVLWIRIFSYSGPTEKETVSFRCLCKLFSKALKPPCWTSFPHPKYSSLGALFNQFNVLSSNGSMNIPKMVLIENGVHEIESYQCRRRKGRKGRKKKWVYRNYVKITIPISIIGESREHCIVMGGLFMNGKKEDDVNVSDLTLRDSMGNGVCGNKGASIHLDNVNCENSGITGVSVYGTKRSTMKSFKIYVGCGCG